MPVVPEHRTENAMPLGRPKNYARDGFGGTADRHKRICMWLRDAGVEFEITTSGLGNERISTTESELVKVLSDITSDVDNPPGPVTSGPPTITVLRDIADARIFVLRREDQEQPLGFLSLPRAHTKHPEPEWIDRIRQALQFRGGNEEIEKRWRDHCSRRLGRPPDMSRYFDDACPEDHTSKGGG